ncbi:MAG TPA: amino acid ABC transporter substrate-binding protein [Rhodocyclaceae bacterium]|nr:amino acid ABC transporter substrate-binding protein [Rhodocyclaceae bacterium]
MRIPMPDRWQTRLLAILLLAASTWAAAQDNADATRLSGTLAKVRESGTIVLGYRESSVPFSYLSAQGEPIGYSIDLCKLLVEAMVEEVGRDIVIRWQMVTAESRLNAVSSGAVDLECGSTTSNLERQKQVSFSPIFFVSGTKLLVKKGSPIRSFRNLAGKTVVVTAGTTNEKTMKDLAARFQIDMKIVSAPDHAASFARLTNGQADAFATDDVLLYGQLAQNRQQGKYVVTGDFLSYDPYGLMFRKGDAQLARLVNDTFHSLAKDGEIERRYTRWFLRKLPNGTSLDLPMSPQLVTIIETMVVRSE